MESSIFFFICSHFNGTIYMNSVISLSFSIFGGVSFISFSIFYISSKSSVVFLLARFPIISISKVAVLMYLWARKFTVSLDFIRKKET